ncbi:rod shape-determining protein RodA [Treponema sp.]|uniref:rod shape-determining protein RodA n=1 Tax=Treponema sp. TaxID=166 RepID=UPI0025E08D1E|nr:rod shape-determining protein RodA [Treponema sp.]MCR5217518.1 rod shape-determining protein RodA [Treponema sp.]
MTFNFLKKYDFPLMICITVLTFFGILFIYSAAVTSEGIIENNEYIKQIIWFSTGLVILSTVTFIDYRKYIKFIPYVYAGTILLLIFTFILGKNTNGATSWFSFGKVKIQPSEFSKIVYILMLAHFLDVSEKINERKRFIYAAIIMFVPMGIILIQPDMGTASVFLPIFLFMCFMAGIPLRYLFMIFFTLVLTLVFTVLPTWETQIARRSIPVIHLLSNRRYHILVTLLFIILTIISALGRILFKTNYYYWLTYFFGIIAMALFFSLAGSTVLKPYQITRLIIFLKPEVDPDKTGYHLIQSKNAIGSGGIFGMGYLQGKITHLKFLPEKNTDFIFSVISEEFGFIAGISIFILYLFIFLRIILIMKQTSNNYATYICAGILGMIFYHFIVNVGMTIGIMPVTGIPLPFLSYGGSALYTNMIAMGLLMSIHSRRLDF